MRIGVMKDSKTKGEESTHLHTSHTLGSGIPPVIYVGLVFNSRFIDLIINFVCLFIMNQ